MKETIQICNNGHLLDWMENGTLEDRHTTYARQWNIKRYNKQRISYLVKWLSDYLREDVIGEL